MLAQQIFTKVKVEILKKIQIDNGESRNIRLYNLDVMHYPDYVMRHLSL